jgi:hypothetical protein
VDDFYTLLNAPRFEPSPPGMIYERLRTRPIRQ